jgi:hypothetical protein
MPENNPEWKTLARNRLTVQSNEQGLDEETVTELAAHMEDIYESALACGLDASASLELALQEIQDGHALLADIHRAKSKEDTMNYRTRSLWLPALVSLFASSLFLFLLTEISMQPPLLVRLNFSAAQWLYAVWIIGQIGFGSLGAFLSRRVGGSRMARVVAGTFPAIVMLAACAIVIPVSALMEHNDFIFHNPGRLWWGTFLWAVVPAITLLLGAAPFLKESTVQQGLEVGID